MFSKFGWLDHTNKSKLFYILIFLFASEIEVEPPSLCTWLLSVLHVFRLKFLNDLSIRQ